MEPSQILGGTEECSASESGWTMYIGSPIHDDDIHQGGDDYGNDDDDDRSTDKGDKYAKDDIKCYYSGDDNNESDDSMASDASSGPSHPELPWGSSTAGHGMGQFKHAESKYSSTKKLDKQVKQRDGRRIKVKKEESVLEAYSSTSRVKSGTKVRKSKLKNGE